MSYCPETCKVHDHHGSILPPDDAYSKFGKREAMVAIPSLPGPAHFTRKEIEGWLKVMDEMEATAASIKAQGWCPKCGAGDGVRGGWHTKELCASIRALQATVTAPTKPAPQACIACGNVVEAKGHKLSCPVYQSEIMKAVYPSPVPTGTYTGYENLEEFMAKLYGNAGLTPGGLPLETPTQEIDLSTLQGNCSASEGQKCGMDDVECKRCRGKNCPVHGKCWRCGEGL